MARSELKLESAPPLTEEEYARVFSVFANISDEYEVMARMASTFITKNKFNENPVKMLSVGAGRGNFELKLVRELGLKLDYIYAVEPNAKHVSELHSILGSLGTEYDISSSFFNTEFQFEESKCDKFDFILFSHSLYGFKDSRGSVHYASKFLKPEGKLVIFNQGEGATAAIFTYLMDKSDPKIFSPGQCIGDHSLTATKIMSQLKEDSSNLTISTMRERCYEDVDDFVRRVNSPERNYKIDFSLQAEFDKLSEEAKNHIYDMVVKNCDVIQGRYQWRHWCVGIVVSLKV